MFIKNLQFAFRSFRKRKATTAINIFGLAVGISASIVIFSIVHYDYSFDKWEPQKNDIYRLIVQSKQGYFLGVPAAAPDAIKKQVAGIETVSHFMDFPLSDFTVTVLSENNLSNKIFNKEKRVVFTDDNYFKIFPHQWLEGNPSSSLSQPNQVVLSLSIAQKYFPNLSLDKILGKRILFGDSTDVSVSGIVSDLDEQSDFDNKSFISLNTITSSNYLKSISLWGDWNFPNSYSNCFVRLYKTANPANVNEQIKKLFVANVTEPDPQFKFVGALQPLNEIHFGNDNKIAGKAQKKVLINLGALALALLLLAIINFINLSTAQSTLRAKEIGLRKTFGSRNKEVIYQFLTETFLLALFATLLAIIIAPFLIYVFKEFIPDGLNTKQLLQPMIIVFLIAIIIVVTFLAGLYPAFVLTKFKPVQILKNQPIASGKSRNAWIREALTVSQFVIAQVFLIVVIVVGKQIHYELNKDIGIRKNAIVSFDLPGFQQSLQSKKTVLMDELKKIPQIQNISLSYGEATAKGAGKNSFSFSNKGRTGNELAALKIGDSNYIKVFDIVLLAGRNFRLDTTGKEPEMLINATMANRMGFQNLQHAVGTSLTIAVGGSHYTVVGVFKDYNLESLHSPIQPLVLMPDPGKFAGEISMALNPSDPASWKIALEKTEHIYKQLYPNKDFEYTFFDKALENIYKSDIRLSTLLKWSTGLAIFISCLGLLGLITFTANQRTREIGIRKVLGATVIQIVGLLSKSSLRLVVLASIIAFPIAWYFSNNWLQDYAYKITIPWWIFLLTTMVAIIIALLTVGYQSVKAAMANPVKSLRSE